MKGTQDQQVVVVVARKSTNIDATLRARGLALVNNGTDGRAASISIGHSRCFSSRAHAEFVQRPSADGTR
jgi:hypothetical protein